MAAVSAEIEALALGAMRAWVAGDVKAMKKLTARDFMFMVGTLPPQLLDRPSFIAAMERGFACTKFAFREVFVRQHGKSAWFIALWRRGSIARNWNLSDMSLARLEEGDRLADAVRGLQLWKQA